MTRIICYVFNDFPLYVCQIVFGLELSVLRDTSWEIRVLNVNFEVKLKILSGE